MRLLVIQRAVRGASRVAETKKTVVADWIRVGRNASCEIHLPDPRIALEQGMIVNRDGLVYIEGEAGSQDITRKSVRSVRLKPGVPLDIGPYRLESRPAPEGFDGAIAVELVHALEPAPELGLRTSRKTWSPPPGKPRNGWVGCWSGSIGTRSRCGSSPSWGMPNIPRR